MNEHISGYTLILVCKCGHLEVQLSITARCCLCACVFSQINTAHRTSYGFFGGGRQSATIHSVLNSELPSRSTRKSREWESGCERNASKFVAPRTVSIISFRLGVSSNQEDQLRFLIIYRYLTGPLHTSVYSFHCHSNFWKFQQ